MDVSVIIVNWNTKDILRDCLRSVFEQTQDIQYEVIVVDNDSTDGSVDMIRSEFPQTILVENDHNRGFAAANNQGMQLAKGQYFLLLNSDTIILEGAIQKTLAYAEQHPESAVVGCRVLNSDKSLQQTCFMYPDLLNLFLSASYMYKMFPKSRFFGREHMTWWDRDDFRSVDVVTGCFMLVRRRATQEVGLMDESFFMYGEETDWCYRFTQEGWKCLFAPVAEIIHLGGMSSKKVRPEMIIQLRRSLLYFIKKHKSQPTYHLSKLLIAYFLILRLPFWLIVKLVSSDRSEEAEATARAYWQGTMEILSQ